MIYRELRTFESPTIAPFQPIITYEMGYCSYGFHWSVLATNRQINCEAKQVFYGENDWTFFVNLASPFRCHPLMLSPIATAFPFMRRAHIRFRMFDWMFLYHNKSPCLPVERLQNMLVEICVVLSHARSLKGVKLIWTETATLKAEVLADSPWDWMAADGAAANALQTLVCSALRPLHAFPYPCSFQRSKVEVRFQHWDRSIAMETAFSNAVDTIIALRERKPISASQNNVSGCTVSTRNSDCGCENPIASSPITVPSVLPARYQKRRGYNTISGVSLKAHNRKNTLSYQIIIAQQ